MRTCLVSLVLALALSGCPDSEPDDDTEASAEDDGADGCTNGLDDDRDGRVDCADSDCEGQGPCGGDDDTTGDDDSTPVDDDSTGDDDSVGDDDTTPTPQGAFLYAATASSLFEIDPVAPYSSTWVADFYTLSGADFAVTDIAIDTHGQMYATTFDDLYQVEVSTGALTHVGGPYWSLSANALTVLADGRMLIGGTNSSQLYEIDSSNGNMTDLGDLDGWLFAGDMVGLPDGLLYCLVSADGEGGSPTSLLIWDGSNGNVVSTGATGVGAMYGVGFGLGTLFGFNEAGHIYTVDQASGAATDEGNLGPAWWGATTNPARWSQ